MFLAFLSYHRRNPLHSLPPLLDAQGPALINCLFLGALMHFRILSPEYSLIALDYFTNFSLFLESFR